MADIEVRRPEGGTNICTCLCGQLRGSYLPRLVPLPPGFVAPERLAAGLGVPPLKGPLL
jgi:hypothetical protein